jgi:hypothetical protein
MGSWIRLTIVLLLSGCVTVPRHCERLIPDVDTVTHFTGKCRKLIYRGEDFTPDCEGDVLLYDLAKDKRVLVFLANDPRELLSFNGPPFSVDPKSLRFEVARSFKAERRSLGTEREGSKEKGACDLVPRDSRSYLIQCQATDEKGRNTVIEFATAEQRSLYCREDFPDKPHGPF